MSQEKQIQEVLLKLARVLTGIAMAGTLTFSSLQPSGSFFEAGIVAEASLGEGTTTEALNLRKGAGTGHGIIRVLKKGEKVTLLSKSGSWYKVKAGSQEGWVHGDYITVSTASVPKTTSQTGTTLDALNFRKGAGTNHSIIQVLPKGTTVHIIKTSGEWLQVKVGQQEGWVHSHYVNISTPATVQTGTTTDALNLRKGGGMGFTIIKVLPKGQKLTIVKESDGWYQVKAGASEGWVHKNYVRLDVTSAFSQYTAKISSSTTYYHGSTAERANNVELAASKINGVVLQPGESYSFTDLVGPVREVNGYKNASVFIGGQVSQGMGGGICQVSSTIYHAQLKAGIIGTERHPHSRAVDYLPLGMDAAMWEGSQDHGFTNTLSEPIQIGVTAKNGVLTVEFRSTANALKGYTYEPRAVLASKFGNKETWDTYLRTYQNGKLISEKYLHRSTYVMY